MVTNRDHLSKLKLSRTLPDAFTEHGALQAANVLASAQSVEMGIHVVRAFAKLREAAIEHRDGSKRRDALEEKTETLAMDHDSFSSDTRVQLRRALDAFRELTAPPPCRARPRASRMRGRPFFRGPLPLKPASIGGHRSRRRNYPGLAGEPFPTASPTLWRTVKR